MAARPPLLSEDQLLCPICLGVFVRPVSTPCGHNFCMSCLSSYWDRSPVSVCPVCNERYSQRPQLRVNTFISGLSQSFMNRPLSPEESQSRETRAELGGIEAELSSMIQARVQKVQFIRQSVAQRQEVTGRLTDALTHLTALVRTVEEKQTQADLEAQEVAEGIEKEIRDLTETQTKLKDVELTDLQVFMQNFPHNFAQSHPLARESELEFQQLRDSFSTSLSQLKTYLDKTGASFVSDISALKYVRRFANDVTLDPTTAHHRLILSRDLTQVKFNPDANANAKPNAAKNSARFAKHLAVLGERGIQSGKFYFEVSVGGKSEWIVGVASASLPRQGKIPHAPGCGVYAVCFRMSYSETFCRPGVQVHHGRMERVGVFVDFEGGQVSFYDVNGVKLIHTFKDCGFVDKIHPYFNPCNNEFGNNLEPLVVVPVDPK